MKISVRVILAVLAVTLAVPCKEASAAFYRLVDENGVIHITNVPTSKKYVWMMRERKDYDGSSVSIRVYGKDYDGFIRATSLRYGIDPLLVKAIVKAESDFNPLAVSRKGARGLMQLMPETAHVVGVRDAHNPEENIEGGIKHLTRLMKTFNWKVHLAVAAYNAGENAVLKYGNIPPYPETRTYVKRVLYYYRSYRDASK